jgi:uncharacterized protein YciI
MHFALKLNPKRATFAQDMTPEERAIMQQHIAYWTSQMRQGIALLFGPVLDPKGVYGLGIIDVADEAAVKALIASDPAAQINDYEFYRMMAIVPEK